MYQDNSRPMERHCSDGQDTAAAATGKKPNIIFVLGDDWGK